MEIEVTIRMSSFEAKQLQTELYQLEGDFIYKTDTPLGRLYHKLKAVNEQ